MSISHQIECVLMGFYVTAQHKTSIIIVMLEPIFQSEQIRLHLPAFIVLEAILLMSQHLYKLRWADVEHLLKNSNRFAHLQVEYCSHSCVKFRLSQFRLHDEHLPNWFTIEFRLELWLDHSNTWIRFDLNNSRTGCRFRIIVLLADEYTPRCQIFCRDLSLL